MTAVIWPYWSGNSIAAGAIRNLNFRNITNSFQHPARQF
jgi:hypothetical protein